MLLRVGGWSCIKYVLTPSRAMALIVDSWVLGGGGVTNIQMFLPTDKVHPL